MNVPRRLLRPPRRTGSRNLLVIDASSRTSLEIVKSTSGEKQGSLLWAIDRTVTGPGGRPVGEDFEYASDSAPDRLDGAALRAMIEREQPKQP